MARPKQQSSSPSLAVDGKPEPTDWQARYLQERQAREKAEAEGKQALESRRWLEAMVASSNDAIIGKTLDGIITFWNPGAERIFGYTAEEMIGRPETGLVPADRLQEMPAILEQLRQGARRKPIETVRLHKDGTLVDVSLSVSPVPDSAGNIIGTSVIGRDITERKRLEAELRYAMAGARCLLWYADIIEPGGGPYLHWDIRLVDMDAAQRFLSLDLRPGESYKDAWYRCREPEDRDACDAYGTASVRAGQSYSQEFRCHTADGAVRWLHEDIRVETVVPGQRWRAFAVCTDFTERKQYQQEIEALNRRLQQAMRETHHRVKNNLQLMASMLDMAMLDYADALPMAEVRRLSQQVITLAALHDVLTHHAIYAEGQTYAVSARVVLSRLLTMLAATAPHFRLEQQIEEVRLSVQQATALSLAANEMVSNAFKHGRETVWVTFRVEGDVAHFQVEDDGPGFPAGFDLQTGAHTGLMLVQSVAVHDLGGSLAWTNRPEGGARLTLTLPLVTWEEREM